MTQFLQLNKECLTRIADEYRSRVDMKVAENNEKADAYGRDIEGPILKEVSSISAGRLESVTELAFGASMQKEEGRFHKFALVLCPPISPQPDDRFYRFESWPELKSLAKLAASIEKSDQVFYVWFGEADVPGIWAFGERSNGYLCLTITSIAAGQIVIKIPYVTLKAESEVRFLGSLTDSGFVKDPDIFGEIFFQSGEFRNYREALTAAAAATRDEMDEGGYERLKVGLTRALWRPGYWKQIAHRMYEHSHGGTLLVLGNSDNLDTSFQPMHLKARESYRDLEKNIDDEEKRFIQQVETGEDHRPRWGFRIFDREAERRRDLLDLIGQLTAIDGATVITREFELLAFGAKIKPVDSTKSPEAVLVSEPFEHSSETIVPLKKFKGTRHQSAAQFVFDRADDSFAIVASEDGPISVIYWDSDAASVKVLMHLEFTLT